MEKTSCVSSVEKIELFGESIVLCETKNDPFVKGSFTVVENKYTVPALFDGDKLPLLEGRRWFVLPYNGDVDDVNDNNVSFLEYTFAYRKLEKPISIHKNVVTLYNLLPISVDRRDANVMDALDVALSKSDLLANKRHIHFINGDTLDFRTKNIISESEYKKHKSFYDMVASKPDVKKQSKRALKFLSEKKDFTKSSLVERALLNTVCDLDHFLKSSISEVEAKYRIIINDYISKMNIDHLSNNDLYVIYNKYKELEKQITRDLPTFAANRVENVLLPLDKILKSYEIDINMYQEIKIDSAIFNLSKVQASTYREAIHTLSNYIAGKYGRTKAQKQLAIECKPLVVSMSVSKNKKKYQFKIGAVDGLFTANKKTIKVNQSHNTVISGVIVGIPVETEPFPSFCFSMSYEEAERLSEVAANDYPTSIAVDSFGVVRHDDGEDISEIVKQNKYINVWQTITFSFDTTKTKVVLQGRSTLDKELWNALDQLDTVQASQDVTNNTQASKLLGASFTDENLPNVYYLLPTYPELLYNRESLNSKRNVPYVHKATQSFLKEFTDFDKMSVVNVHTEKYSCCMFWTRKDRRYFAMVAP